ncbi:hypothetical protein [Streptomyces badius]
MGEQHLIESGLVVLDITAADEETADRVVAELGEAIEIGGQGWARPTWSPGGCLSRTSLSCWLSGRVSFHMRLSTIGVVLLPPRPALS